MATTINATDYKRSDIFIVDPNDVIVREELRGRHEPPSHEAITELAVSIFTVGQKQAGCARKLKHEADRIELTAGFSRWAAIQLLREGFEYGGKTYHVPDQRFLVSVVNGQNDLDALKANITENRHRNGVSPIDDAHNMRRLERMGQTQEEIAAFYMIPESKVEKTLSLLALSTEEQKRVHSGQLPVSAAYELLNLPEGERAEIVAQVTAEAPANGKIKGTAINSAIRERRLTNSPPTTARPNAGKSSALKFMPRTLADLKKVMELDSKRDDSRGELARILLAYAAGQISEAKFSDDLDKVLA